MKKGTSPEANTQVSIGIDSFSLGALSEEARNTISLLAMRPDLVARMGMAQEREAVWQYCSDLCGGLNEKDLRTLNTLYELFVAPGSVKVIQPGTTTLVESPINTWIGED